MAFAWIETVTEADFNEKVVAASEQAPVLVDFWAAWCGPCLALTPVLERVVESYQGQVRLAKVNTDENPNLSYRYFIQSIPAVKAFIGGEVVNEFVGALPERAIRDFIDGLVPSEAERLTVAARALEPQDPAGALRGYDQALAHDGRHPAALIGRVRMLAALDRIEDARARLAELPPAAQLEPDFPRLQAQLELAAARASGPATAELRARAAAVPDDLEAQWALAQRLAAEGGYAEALALFLAIVRRDRRFRDDGARKAMLQIFEVIGARAPLAEQFRAQLAEVLF